MSLPTVSVIIPTYNRKDSLLRTLRSLAQQTYPTERFEVIVVDDGGSDGTEGVSRRDFPFALHYVRQDNQGATVARNTGASASSGEILTFVDDDIQLHPQTLERLLAVKVDQRTIPLGALATPSAIGGTSVFAGLNQTDHVAEMMGADVTELPFQECMTGLLSVRREDFVALGGFQDPTGGWPNWDDVDFGYRAHLAGYRLIRVWSAVAEHWDHALVDLRSACFRWERAGHSGAALLQRYPELANHIPMFDDKAPIIWLRDPPTRILRKLARQVASSRTTMWAMEHAEPVVERHAPGSTVLKLLYRWIISGHIYRGYREGLRDIARCVASVEKAVETYRQRPSERPGT